MSGGRCVIWYCPSSFDVTVRVWFVDFDLTVTVALGTTAPVGSATLPSMPPVGCCARDAGGRLRQRAASERRRASRLVKLFLTPPSVSVCVRTPAGGALDVIGPRPSCE